MLVQILVVLYHETIEYSGEVAIFKMIHKEFGYGETLIWFSSHIEVWADSFILSLLIA